jgi:hypothetical protein
MEHWGNVEPFVSLVSTWVWSWYWVLLIFLNQHGFWIKYFWKVSYQHDWHTGFKGHLGSRDQKPKDQFEANSTLNWTLLHIKKTFFLKVLHIKKALFPKVGWVCLKVWGSIQRSTIENVRLACERIKFITIFFPSFFSWLVLYRSPLFFSLTKHNGWT